MRDIISVLLLATALLLNYNVICVKHEVIALHNSVAIHCSEVLKIQERIAMTVTVSLIERAEHRAGLNRGQLIDALHRGLEEQLKEVKENKR